MKAGIEGSFNAVDVRDLADATVAAIENGRPGEGYILGNERISMKEMLRLVALYTKTPPVTTILPAFVGKVLGHATDLIVKISGRPRRMTSFAVYNLTRNNEFDSSKASHELGFHTRPFFETIADTVTWLIGDGRVQVGGVR